MHPSAPPPTLPRKKTPVWVWILACIGGFILLMILLVVAGGLWVANKAMEALDDPKKMAEIVHQVNPDLDIVDVDKERKRIRVRDKEKDEVYTVSLDELARGRLRLEKEGKDGVESIELGGQVNLPNWVPVYPGSEPKVVGQARSDKRGEGGLLEFRTSDEPDKIRAFFKQQAEKKGFTVDTTAQEAGADHYVSEDGTLHLVIDVDKALSGNRVHVLFGEKKKK